MTHEQTEKPAHPHPTGSTAEPAPPLSPSAVERQFLDAERRARRYWYEDGLGEIAVGAVFAILGLYFATQAFLAGRLGRTADVLLNLLFPLIVLTAGVGLRRIISRVKERLVYPRAGYATYPKARGVPKWVTGMIAGGVAGLIAVLARTAPGIEAWLPAVQGFLVAGFLWWLARLSGLARFQPLALGSALLGLAVALLAPSSTVSAALFFGPLGLALVVSGWLAFRRFTRAADGVGE